MACFVFSAEHMLAWADKDLSPGQSSHARRRGEGTSTLHRGLRQRGTSPSFLRPSPAQTDRQTGSRGETATRGTGDPERAEGVVSPARRRPSTERKTKREGRRSMRKRGHAGSGQLNKTTHQSPPARPEHFAMQRVPLPRPPPPLPSSSSSAMGPWLGSRRNKTDRTEALLLAGDDVWVRRNVTSGPQVESGRCSQTRLGLPIDDWARFYRMATPQPGQDGAS